MHRASVTVETLEATIEQVIQALRRRLEQKGRGAFVSVHEILGVAQEEHIELTLAVQSNDHEHVHKELLDVAVGAMFGIASMIQLEYESQTRRNEQ